MTAASAPAGPDRRVQPTSWSASWRRLTWVAWRQHRAVLAGLALLFAASAIVIAVSGLRMHEDASRFGALQVTSTSGYAFAMLACVSALQAMPVITGLFAGAPLLARETETGTSRLAWTQGASRTRWLLAKVVPMVLLLALAALALGLEFRWWLAPFENSTAWGSELFNLNPLPLAGWVTLSLCLGVFLGALTRRTVPAMAATIVGYAALLGVVSAFLRPRYLPPLHRSGPRVTFSGGGSYGVLLGGSGHPPGPDILSTAPGRPDGRLLSNAELNHGAAWFSQHHITLWTTYQPGSRFVTFQLIEFGWLIALSAILIAATVVLIRRRAA